MARLPASGKIWTAAISVLLATGGLVAPALAAPVPAWVNQIVARDTGSKATVIRAFTSHGILGVELRFAGQSLVGWIPSRKHPVLYVGGAYTRNGLNLTGVAAEELGLSASSAPPGAPPKPAMTATEYYRAVQRAPGFWEGQRGMRWYVFFDPNCIYCHILYEKVQPLVQSGQVRIDWIPVGILKPSSRDKAESILSAPQPLQAMAENEARFNVATEEGGIAPDHQAPPAIQAAIKANTDLLTLSGGEVTPTIVFMGKHHVDLDHGIPESGLGSILQENPNAVP